jgi:signal transduction histidine kinase
MRHIVAMVEGAIELTRTLARGLHPYDLNGEGFTDALRELAGTITDGFKIPCSFECDKPVLISEPGAALHLYRIAQEAISNAVKHSKATKITMRLEETQDGVALTISDDGVGLTESPPTGNGMGLRTMAYRASVIGAMFNVEKLNPRGTRVICQFHQPHNLPLTHGAKS